MNLCLPKQADRGKTGAFCRLERRPPARKYAAADGGTGEARVQVRGVVLRFLGGGLWRDAQIYARFHEAVRRGARAGDLQLFRASARLPKALRNAGCAALAFLRRAEKIRILHAGRHPAELQGQRFAQHRPRYRKLACVRAGF